MASAPLLSPSCAAPSLTGLGLYPAPHGCRAAHHCRRLTPPHSLFPSFPPCRPLSRAHWGSIQGLSDGEQCITVLERLLFSFCFLAAPLSPALGMYPGPIGRRAAHHCPHLPLPPPFVLCRTFSRWPWVAFRLCRTPSSASRCWSASWRRARRSWLGRQRRRWRPTRTQGRRRGSCWRLSPARSICTISCTCSRWGFGAQGLGFRA